MPGAGKPSDKPQPSAGRKNGDTTRKQSDGGQSSRRSPAPRAWQSGMNPITNRSNNVSQQNGSNTSAIKPGAKPALSHESAGPDKAAHDRLLYLFANLLGQNATVTIKSGDVFSGLFWGATAENQSVSYQLKMVQQTKHGEKPNAVNGARDQSKDFIGSGDEYSMIFENKDIVGLSVEGIDFLTSDRQANGASGFRTDTDISGNLALRERELQRWTASSDDAPGLSLEDTNGGGADWDQFKANERLFGLKSDYDENIYTTSLDRSSSQYRQQEAKAQRIAREIESSVSNSAHTREERGLADDDGELDEEEKYSGVRRPAADYPPLRSTQPNRYMPPARRPPSGQPSVSGAPVDPAIISSQMARPDVSPKRTVDQPAAAKTEATTAVPVPAEPFQAEASNDQLPIKTPNATANVETEVLDSFRTFAEKQKTKVADDRQKRVRHEKDIKLNDLKGFSRTFKLHTPVPNDLVPILAKDKKKQDEILEKARREVEEHAKSPSKTAKVVEEAPARPTSDRREVGKAGNAPPERQDLSSFRQQAFPPRGPQASMNRDRSHPHANSPSGNAGLLSHRLNETQRAHKAGAPVAIPTPLPLHNGQKPPSRPSGTYVPGSQASSTARTPTSANSIRFNVQASEFKPNPAANSFKQAPPTNAAAAASPRPKVTNRRTSPAASINDFFGGKKMLSASQRPNILEHFNPLKRLKEKAEKEGKSKDYSANGGIIYAHATPVTWSVLKDDEPETSYKDMFDDIGSNAAPGASPQRASSSPMNPGQSHVHQVPAHLHHTNTSHSPSPNPNSNSFGGPHQPHMFVQSGAPHAYDDPRMHGSPSASAYSTPRMPGNFISYPTTMGPGMQFPYAQQVPHMVAPGGPQPPNFRQFSNGHQYMPSPGQQMAAPMMVSQSSSGGYMGSPAVGVPHVPMYPAGPAAGYGGPAQPSSGYPSPGRSAPMMMHQGSYQGQSPAMHPVGPQYGQPYFAQGQMPHMNPMRGYPSPQPPHFGHSPQQQYHYPPQPTRMPSHGYGAHPPGGSSGAPAQPVPAAAGGVEGGEVPK